MVASDSQLTLGTTKLIKPQMKRAWYGQLCILYAGTLHTIDKVFSESPDPHNDDFTELEQFRQRIWTMKKELKAEPCDFLVVDEEQEIHIVSTWGDILSGYHAACIGSEFGWIGLDLLLPTQEECHKLPVGTVRARLMKVLGAVASRDNTVCAPFYTDVA
jgi:hypothetical protein